jgi:ketosteroid isomerase-like protein
VSSFTSTSQPRAACRSRISALKSSYLACCTRDIELHTPLVAVAGVYEGRAGIRRFFADVEDAAPDFRLALERLRAIGADQVLALLDITASGRASGLPTGTPTANVYELANGKIKRIRIFADRQEALEAVGLSEQAMWQENVETIMELWEGWMKGNPDWSLVDPEVVYEDNSLPDHVGEIYRGHEGLLKAWARFTEPWDSFEKELEWMRHAEDEVVSCHRVRGRGKGSGAEAEGRYAYVWRLQKGKVVYVKSYGYPAEALEAVGLSE